ncbi:hypothetical protein [Hymenobacter negativus]|uniref:TPM domain-containing protein n=1 Tax=Hymenobacter negativus TaxID=2795026 RepID=A0ABS3QBX8_9BACT|nr:hypothetical protein [Hymenobacter negativus]MBO2008744.1 hypothetical protein [Hymenobacter negativus]
MTFRFVLAVLLAAMLLRPASPLRAQTPLGQPSLDESKVQIWCATVRFVYDDAGRPNLKSTVRCEGGNLDALATSIRPDSLRVYSLLYQPIEGKGAIYQGKKDNPARLAALAKAIVSKLKGSPARRKDPARMARVAALETALTNYVVSGTPLGEVPTAMTPEAPDTAVTAGTTLGPAEAAELAAAADRNAAGTGAASATSTESLLFRFAAPLALILSILSLVLYIMLRITLGHWRRQQRRETLTAKQAATAAQAAASETSAAVADSVARVKRAEALVLAASESQAAPAATPVLEQLSPAQRLEVERLVSQRVDEELRWLRANLPELVAAVVAQPPVPMETNDPKDVPLTDTATANPAGPIADDVQTDQ